MGYGSASLIHIATAVAALVFGFCVLGLRKGTRRHKQLGYCYVVSMFVTNLSAFLIFRLNGHFGPFHAAALLSLATMLAAFLPVVLRRPRDRWLELHSERMAWSYVGLLAAAASEAAVRLPAAPFWPAVVISTVVICAVGGYFIVRNRPRFVTSAWLANAQQALAAGAAASRQRG